MLKKGIMLFGVLLELQRRLNKQYFQTLFVSRKLDIIFSGVLGVVTVVLWLPTRQLPYWWDSAGFVIHAARFYLETNFSSFILPSDAVITNMAHSPIFPFALALVWKIFGESLLVSHLFYLFFVLCAVLSTYALGVFVGKNMQAREQRWNFMPQIVGVGAAILLLFTPFFLAQIGVIYMEIPTAAFAVLAVYFFFQRRWKLYVLFAVLMLFMKIVSVVVLGAIIFGLFLRTSLNLRNKKSKKQVLQKFSKEGLFVLSPVLVLIAWFFWHWKATGWLFTLPYYENTFQQEVFSISFSKIIAAFKFFFFAQFRWIIAMSLFTIGFTLIFRQQITKVIPAKAREPILILTLIVVCVPLFFGKLEFLPRYVVFALPFFLILAVIALEHLLQKKSYLVFPIIGILAFVFSLTWETHERIISWRFIPIEENIEYIDVIKVGKEMTSFVEANYEKDIIIYTSFPSDYMLAEPFQGYSSNAFEVHNCKEYQLEDRLDLVVFHYLSPPQIQCRYLIQRLRLIPIEGFAYNGKWMQIYGYSEEDKKQENDL